MPLVCGLAVFSLGKGARGGLGHVCSLSSTWYEIDIFGSSLLMAQSVLDLQRTGGRAMSLHHLQLCRLAHCMAWLHLTVPESLHLGEIRVQGGVGGMKSMRVFLCQPTPSSPYISESCSPNIFFHAAAPVELGEGNQMQKYA